MISLLSFQFHGVAPESYRVAGSCAASLLVPKRLSDMQQGSTLRATNARTCQECAELGYAPVDGVATLRSASPSDVE
jgi:hypothetical protein